MAAEENFTQWPWIDIEQTYGRTSGNRYTGIFKHGDPDFMLRRRRQAGSSGRQPLLYDREIALFARHPTPNGIVRYKHSRRGFVGQGDPRGGFLEDGRRAVHRLRTSKRLAIVRAISPRRVESTRSRAMRIDAFDAGGPARIGRGRCSRIFRMESDVRKLDGHRGQCFGRRHGTQAVAAGGLLLVTDAQGFMRLRRLCRRQTQRGFRGPLNVIPGIRRRCRRWELQDWTDGATLAPSIGGSELRGKLSSLTIRRSFISAADYSDAQLSPRRGVPGIGDGRLS